MQQLHYYSSTGGYATAVAGSALWQSYIPTAGGYSLLSRRHEQLKGSMESAVTPLNH
jgi:hypothetical protein